MSHVYQSYQSVIPSRRGYPINKLQASTLNTGINNKTSVNGSTKTETNLSTHVPIKF